MIRKFIAMNRQVCSWLKAKYPTIFGDEDYRAELLARIYSRIGSIPKDAMILEVGGIDRPLLEKSPNYTYAGLDIEERPSCYGVYDLFLAQSVEMPAEIAADIIVSITLLEHVPSNEAATRSMFSMLKPGGVVHHYVPSKWHPYSMILRAIGNTWQRRLIRIVRPEASSVSGYPAFFDHCTTREMRKLHIDAGYVNAELRAFYRAADYFAFFVPAFVIVAVFENLCELFAWDLFASGFLITCEKPRH